MIGGGAPGKTFLEKSFPRTPFKRLGTRVRDMADLEFYRFGSAVQGSVRSTIGDPDLRSPSGFDFGLRPPLRMTRRGGVMLFQCGDNHYAMIAPTVFINI